MNPRKEREKEREEEEKKEEGEERRKPSMGKSRFLRQPPWRL